MNAPHCPVFGKKMAKDGKTSWGQSSVEANIVRRELGAQDR